MSERNFGKGRALSIAELKSRMPIPDAWRLLGLPGEPGTSCISPFRPEERRASFSVYADGTRAKDFTTGETFDVVDFIQRALECDTKGALQWMRERLGESPAPVAATVPQAMTKTKPWPRLRHGKPEELEALARLRTLPLPAIKLVAERGFLCFGEQWGVPFWGITDLTRRCLEMRRMNGAMWPGFGSLSERKAHCIGDKSQPIGLEEAKVVPNILLVEGVGDFLAAHQFIYAEVRTADTAAMCCLGASAHIAAEAARAVAGKRVRIIPQMDEPGQKAARRWALSLHSAGARVDGFSLAGITDTEGQQINDLGDAFAKASPESLKQNPQLLEVCP